MPANYRVRLHNQRRGTPVHPDSREDCPKDAIPVPQTRPLGLLPQGSELLAKGEILQSELRPVTDKRTDEQRQNTKQTHLTASKNVDSSLETIAGTWNASNRKSFVDKEYGIIARNRSKVAGHAH
jgi:hypothetical protein